MAKYARGAYVELAFNKVAADPRVPAQCAPWTDSRGRKQAAAPGRGSFQQNPDVGRIAQVVETENGATYLVEVGLDSRKRWVPETKIAREVSESKEALYLMALRHQEHKAVAAQPIDPEAAALGIA